MKSIRSVKTDFDKYIRFRVNNGQQVHFWDDLRCGTSLKDQFPSVYLVDRSRHAVVIDFFSALIICFSTAGLLGELGQLSSIDLRCDGLCLVADPAKFACGAANTYKKKF